MAQAKLPEPADAAYEADPVSRIERRRAKDGAALSRRVLAFFIDFVIIGLIFGAFFVLNLLTFGLLTPLLALGPVIPVAYHTMLIGGEKSGTIGMQFLDLSVRSDTGGRPSLLQAFAMTALFYLTTSLTSGLILLFALFHDRRRCLHDVLSGTIVVRQP